MLKSALLFLALPVLCLAQKDSLLIGPGDNLHVQVFDTPEMDQHPRVTDSGEIPLLFIGNIRVAGMTPAEAGHSIEEALKAKNYMLHPQVTINVDKYATQIVYVMGEVKLPGGVYVSTPVSVLSVLAQVGGLGDMADRNITIERHGSPDDKVSYFFSNLASDSGKTEVMVNPGDTIIVHRAGVVYVLGDVGRPGGFPMSTNDSKMDILQALAAAGSANRTSILSKARLIRKTATGVEDVPIELAKIQTGKAATVFMQPDDVLFIPFSFMKNVLLNGTSIAAASTSALIYAH